MMGPRCRPTPLLWLLLALSQPAFAEGADGPETTPQVPSVADDIPQGMTITGDRELPQVLYIIPWQELRAPMPDAPQLKDSIQTPLTPCDTGQALGDYQAELWNCPPER